MEWIMVFCVLGLVVVVSLLIGIIFKEKDKGKREKFFFVQNTSEYDSEVFYAEVVYGRIKEHFDGEIRTPRYSVDYFVTFEVEGEKREFLVPKEVFENIQKGEKGTLVIKNNTFMSFAKQ